MLDVTLNFWRKMDGNSVNSTTCLEEWTVNDVCDKIREKYDEDVSKKFKG